jgi:protein-S-isoprenylcysteine O-methyltransferase Ste14
MAVNILNNIADFTPATGLFLLIFLITKYSVLLKKKGVKVSIVTTQKTGLRKWSYPVLVFLLLLFIAQISNPLTSFSLLPEFLNDFLIDSLFVRIAGAVSVFLSVLLMKITLKDFGNSLRFGLNENNAGNLVTKGVFSQSRNPFFLSLLLFFTGTALIFPNLFFLIFAVSAFAGIHFSILKEEKFMLQVYGEEYFTYQQKVRRYF